VRLHALVRLGETGRAEQEIADIGEQGRGSGEIRMALAALRIAQGDPHAASVVLAPILDGAVPVPPATWLAHACLLEAIARDALGDPAAARDAMGRALDIAEPGGAVTAFLFHPSSRELFDRYTPDHGERALVAEIRSLLPAGPKPRAQRESPRLADSFRLVDPLSKTEIRVLRYLPTNLSTPEIARELSLSVHTVGHTYATSSPSSARTVVARPSRAPAPSACSLHLAARPEVSGRLPGPAEHEKGSAGHGTYCSADDSAAAKAGCRCRRSMRT
jgi:LuxR family transcriptional regulator, maltose regulon positive regulatory protein